MLPPDEFKPKTFSRSMRGYNTDEVDKYIDFLLERYAALYRENKELEYKLNAALQKSEQTAADEEEIKNTIVLARKAADKIVSDAQQQADLLFSVARSNTDRVLREFRDSVASEAIILKKLKAAVGDMRSIIYKQYLENISQLESLAPKSKYEGELEEPKTAEYISAVIEGMKKDVESVPAEPETETDGDGVTIARSSGPASPRRYRITSVRETIKELNKQILSQDAEGGVVTVDGGEILPPDSDIRQPKRAKPKKKKKDRSGKDIFDAGEDDGDDE